MSFSLRCNYKPLLFKKLLLFTCSPIFFVQLLCAQSSDSPLFEGPTYADVHRSINDKHKFIGSYDFVPAAILYEGEWQLQLAAKYDAYQQQLLLRHPRAEGAPTIVVFTALVSEFRLRNRRFVKLSSEKELFETGFFEVLSEGPTTSLYKKHLKKIGRKQRDGLVYFEFKDKPTYLLKDNGVFSVLKKPKAPYLKALIQKIEASKTKLP